MARERMVTRTINVTEVTAICMDITTVETQIKTLEITGSTYNNDTALKVLKKNYETDTFKVVAVQEIITKEEMYGLTEIEFLKYARKLDPATRKAISDNVDTDGIDTEDVDTTESVETVEEEKPKRKSRK